ncbi:hypothetical protein HS088_TW04G01127 [Tripterygium wilfordii]|uniref:Prolamin-like domain-containing protein n=1 Tax=Tripterygium wilfordii TaxID=458696 RepID=A0A7J7DSP3_TRIWF|nr:hypothetical protein HS088_TW04G01127 [Tripterygium wilfordii]
MAIFTTILFRITVAQLPLPSNFFDGGLPLPPLFPGGGGLPLPPFFPGGGGLPLPPLPGGGGPADVIKCWSSIVNVPGCVQEILGSIVSGQIGKIGPNCCNAINGITQDCWPKLFPVTPLFPPLLKYSCAISAELAAAEEPEAP